MELAARIEELLAELTMLIGAEVLALRCVGPPVLASMEVLGPFSTEMKTVRLQSKRSPPEGSSEALLSAGALVRPSVEVLVLPGSRGAVGFSGRGAKCRRIFRRRLSLAA